MNIILPLFSDLRMKNECLLKLYSSISYLLKCKKHMMCISEPRMMMVRLNKLSNGITVVIRFVFQLKHSIIDFLVEANKLHGDSHDTPIMKSKSSSHSRSSTFSTSSATLKFIEAKAKAAELKVKANFLKEKQALRMASEELELRREIVEAKAEEKTYEQFDEKQIIDGMNDHLKDVTAKLTCIPILSDAQPNSPSTLKVPSVKFQSSAIVSTRRN